MPPLFRCDKLTVRFIFFTGVWLIVLSNAAAQNRTTVRGRTFEQHSGQPIPGVNVIVRGEKKGTVTDSAGSFRLDLPSDRARIIVFSHVAYQKVTRLVSFDSTRDVTLQIAMVSDTIALKEVLVTGKKQIVPSKAAEQRAAYHIGGDEFERLGEQDMERALSYFLPFVIKRPESRMVSSSADFTLYVNGEWKESIELSDLDPFRVRRVLVWDYLGVNKSIDLFPIGMPIHTGQYVILVEMKQQ
jgi:hypothetical protein